uniref:AXH domain-containing protein n=1 Tax=Electrophorus electricus TaxID=8005 RepID=A0AAY5ELY1_ELEEL
MKPAQERNQECLPPKKRDLPLNNTPTTPNSSNSAGGGGGGGGEETASAQSSGASGEPQGGGGSTEWVRTQPSLHYGVEGPDSLAGLPVDQYSMLYKVALPSVTYSPTSLHPVLSHISPAYTVPSPLLQHAGIPYPPLGYTPVPHSSLQFVSSPYAAAVPYAVPPGFVPSPLISPQSAIPQPHPVSHLVPYSSVIQEGVVSSPPQQQVPGHAYAKVAAPTTLPLVLSSEQLSPRTVPVFYQPSGSARATHLQRDPHGCLLEQEREVNGGEREHEGREHHQDTAYLARSVRPPQAAPGGVILELQPDRIQKSRRQEGRASPGQRSTPDMDLEVQQVVGRLASPVHSASRREVTHGPSQNSQRSREVQGEGRTVYGTSPAGQLDLRQQHYPGQPNDSTAGMASPTPYSKASEAAATSGIPERTATEPPPAPAASALPPAQAPSLVPAGPGPSHFMKGAIIQLATGELKRVEDLQTQDFVRSAEVSGGLKIDSSMVVDIRGSHQRPGLVALHFTVGEQQSRVTIDVPPEHPFFVFGQGWSSCSPERTAQLYGLACHHLQVGDVCVSVALQQQATPQPKLPPPRAQRERDRERADKDELTQAGVASQRRWSAPGFQRYTIKTEEGVRAPPSASGSSRPSFIPQEVKLSIEGRSNAGK